MSFKASVESISIHSNLETLPYTYLLVFVHPEGLYQKFYYGARYAKGCHPSDFGIKYFTSSKHVKRLKQKYGKECFIFEIRRIFPEGISECIEYEHKVLRRMKVKSRIDFLNYTTNRGIIPSEKQKEAARNFNHKASWTQERKDAVSKRMKGFKHSDEFKKRRSEYMKQTEKTLTHKAKLKEHVLKLNKSKCKPVTDGVRIFESLEECGKSYGISANAVAYRINSKNYPDFRFI